MSADATITRRQLLKGSAIATAAGALGPFFPGRVLGANDRVNVAIVGTRGQGTAHIKEFATVPGVRVKTLCDLDENILEQRLAGFEKSFKYRPGGVADLRHVLDDKDIDAVSFAIPNHWHALATIWACQAKKHVYVEKPASHTVWEGRQMVNAARKYGVIVQVGFQNRSRPSTRAAIKLIHDGKLGKIYMARGHCFKARPAFPAYPDGPMPEGSKFKTSNGDEMPGFSKSYLEKVHYDLWVGPAPNKPFNPNRFHYNWHWQWDYGNGDTGNQGPHQFDIGRWGLNKDEYPVRVESMGGAYAASPVQETPNTQTSIFEYADGTIFEFSTRGLFTNAEGGVTVGNIFYGSEGRLEIDSSAEWKTFFGPKSEPGPDSKSFKTIDMATALKTVGAGLTDHFVNFIDCVRSHNQEHLNCDIEVGFRSSVLPHMANISYRMKKELKFDGKKEQFVGDPAANKLLTKEYRKGFAVPKLG